MPEYVAVRCVECGVCQVQQRKKSVKSARSGAAAMRWSCAVCRKKQSMLHELGASHRAADLRPLVQRLNLERGAAEERRQDREPEREAAPVPVHVAYDPVWKELLSSSGEDENDDEGEELPLYRTAPPSRRRGRAPKQAKEPKPPVAKKTRQEEEDEPPRQMRQSAAVPMAREDPEEDPDDDGFVSVRNQRLEVVEEEVWESD